MTDLDVLYDRNEAFAAAFDQGHLPIKPALSTIILSCVDARTDPAHYAGLQLGDALTLRTVGARVTDAVATEVAVLWALMAMASGAEPSLELVIIHHTQCGMARFAQPEVAAQVSERFGTDEIVDTYGISDLDGSLATDLDRLRSNPRVPRGLTVSGHVYDVATGRLRQVIERQQLG